jgi:hypothetical protein
VEGRRPALDGALVAGPRRGGELVWGGRAGESPRQPRVCLTLARFPAAQALVAATAGGGSSSRSRSRRRSRRPLPRRRRRTRRRGPAAAVRGPLLLLLLLLLWRRHQRALPCPALPWACSWPGRVVRCSREAGGALARSAAVRLSQAPPHGLCSGAPQLRRSAARHAALSRAQPPPPPARRRRGGGRQRRAQQPGAAAGGG